MELKAAVFYKGYLAHYAIFSSENGAYTASLLKYDGNINKQPLAMILLKKEGCRGRDENTDEVENESSEQEFLDDLGSIIDYKLTGYTRPLH